MFSPPSGRKVAHHERICGRGDITERPWTVPQAEGVWSADDRAVGVYARNAFQMQPYPI